MFSTLVVRVRMPFTSVFTLWIMSTTCDRVWFVASRVSNMASRSSLFPFTVCSSTTLCFLASESTFFRNCSTGLSKATTQVAPQKARVERAEAARYVVDGIDARVAPISGYCWRRYD